MRLAGSCHCQRVRFELDTAWHHPYQWCFCEICRKTNGSAFGCNIKGRKADFRILQGEEHLKKYRAVSVDRYFCGACGSQLFILDDAWPDGVWPNAAAIAALFGAGAHLRAQQGALVSHLHAGGAV